MEKNKKILQSIYGSFKRLGNFPIDPSAYYETKAEVEEYIQNNRTAFVGQQIVVYGEQDAGIYIVSEGNNRLIIKPLSEFGELGKSLSEINEKIFDVTERLAAVELSNAEFQEKIDGIINVFIENTNKKLEENENKINDLSEKIDENYTTLDTKIDREINAILGFDLPANFEDGINTIKEIKIWVQNYADEVHEWIATHSNEFNSLKTRVDNLEAGAISNILKDLVLKIDNNPTGTNNPDDFIISQIYDQRLKSGIVIKSAKFVTAPNISVSSKESLRKFNLFINNLETGSSKILLKGVLDEYDEALGDEYLIPLIDITKGGESFDFDINYEVPYKISNGNEVPIEYSLSTEIESEERCTGTLYITYFKK